MIVRVSIMIAHPVRIRPVRYRLQRHLLPVRPLLQPVLRIQVSSSCTLEPAMIMTSMCSIQMTVSRKETVRSRIFIFYVYTIMIKNSSSLNFIHATQIILDFICPDYQLTQQKSQYSMKAYTTSFRAQFDMNFMHSICSVLKNKYYQS